MPQIVGVPLPGVGVRHEFVSATGRRIVVVTHRGGRREISVSRANDPDTCDTLLTLETDDATALGEILGAPHIVESMKAMQRIEGLAIDWLPVRAGSSAEGSTIAAGEYRTRTGTSIVAVIRGDDAVAAPEPDFSFEADDVVVAVGTTEGLEQLRALLSA
jgi:TrkA domain protein